ncbi:MAG: fatty acid--CoA ligase family protein [Deltaproteobacteria bacterium]|nr:fatty acid--CoA ligase family protein [Deltaproteobacteria bacterium]
MSECRPESGSGRSPQRSSRRESECIPLATVATIPGLVARAAVEYADLSALEEGELRSSFAQLAAAGIESTRAFLAAGVRPGERVAIWAPNSSDWIVAAIGLQSAGAALVPINTRFKAAEAGYVLAKSGAKVLVTTGEFLGVNYADSLGSERPVSLERIVTLRGSSKTGEPWPDFLAAGANASEDEARMRSQAVRGEDVADIMFTSGTTGKPKGVIATHFQNVRVFEAWSDVVGLREGDRYLIANPFFHAFGYKSGWMASIMRGATMLPHAVFEAAAVLDRIAREKITVFPGPPAIFQSLLALPDLSKYDISSLRLAVTGAAVIPVELVHRMRDVLGFETVVTGYGLTECSGAVSMCRHDDDPVTIATTSGRPLPGVEIRCVDASGRSVRTGDAGEILVRGYNVMRGYFEDEAATKETIDSEGWLHTGDVGTLDAAGNLRITDRIKDMYIMGGFNCYPAEIENLMFTIPGIAQVAVIGVPDERMGEVGMAFVVEKKDAGLTESGVIAACRERMANYKVPRFVRVVPGLPMNATGKVTKFALREQAKRVGGD